MIKRRVFGSLFVVGVGIALAATCPGTADASSSPTIAIYNEQPRLDAVFVEGSGFWPGAAYEIALENTSNPSSPAVIHEYTGAIPASGIIDVEFGDLPIGPYPISAVVVAIDPRTPSGVTFAYATGGVD
jgi:hypothetical protein